MTSVVIQNIFKSNIPCGYSCPPGEEIWSPDGSITEVCWLLNDPNDVIGRGWIERKKNGKLAIKSSLRRTKWAYRLKKPDGSVEIIGNQEAWLAWKASSVDYFMWKQTL